LLAARLHGRPALLVEFMMHPATCGTSALQALCVLQRRSRELPNCRDSVAGRL
jgi:hypothetical protein